MFCPDVIYEDNHLLVVNKRAGEIVQGDKTRDISLVEQYKLYIKAKYNKPGEVFLGLPHRLDRPVGGVCVLSKTSKALARLNDMFCKHGAIDKCYWALVTLNDIYEINTHVQLKNWLVKNEKLNKSFVCDEKTPNAKYAELEFSVLKKYERWMLIEVHLKTGRHHQIRCQLSNIGLTIRGDLKYGAARSLPNGAICLHAKSITLEHPVRKTEVRFESPLPPYMQL